MAIGDLVATLSVPGEPGAVFTLISNPGGYFAISGATIVQAVNAPAGTYTIEVEATDPGLVVIGNFTLQHTITPIPGTFFLGLNLSGMEDNGGIPSLAEMQYWVAKGITHFRIPLNWATLQPTVNGSLNGTYTAQISGIMASAATAGAKLILDFHNFGFAPSGLKLGTISGTEPISSFVNGWVAFSTFLRSDPNFASVYGYDVMNEWNTMDINNPSVPSNAYSQSVVLACNQAVVAALRAGGDNTLLILEWDHYSGAWDAVANNVLNLFTGISDPANNWLYSPHCYPDPNSSGTYETVEEYETIAGSAPTGLNVNPNIIQQRMAAVVALAQQHGIPVLLGETGWTSDNVYQGGVNNFAYMNQIGVNALTFAQSNKIATFAWSSGPGFGPATYAYDPAPFVAGTSNTKIFDGSGVQSSQVVVYEQFTGYSGAQPTAYTAVPPYANGTPIVAYTPSGTPLGGYTLYYGGVISTEAVITGTATLSDGTNVGGTFSSLNMAPGQNGLTTFSYTPAGSYAGISLNFTNNQGWTNPPSVGISSAQDFFNTTIGAIAPNIYALRLLNTPYIGPAIRLQRATDGAQMDFYFNPAGNLPRQVIQNWASSRTIQLVMWYDQSGNGNNLSFNSTSINLILVDASGYPSILVSGAVIATAGTPSIGNGLMTAYAEINPTNTGNIATQDWFSNNFRLTPAAFDIAPNSASPTSVTIGATSSVWSDIAATYSNVYGTNNLKSYIAGSVVNQVSAPQFVNASAQNSFNAFNFQFGDQHYLGSSRGLILQYLEYSAAELSTLHGLYNAYYTTALPDSLSAVNPTITGASASSLFTATGQSNPFSGVTIADTNPGSPTDTVTITLSGAAATLTGSGITGSNPYTIASASAASVTTTLRALLLNSTASVGSTITATIAVTSSAGTSASNSATVVTLAAYGIETAFTPPTGTFTPISYKGVNLAGGENSPSPIYPTTSQIDYFAAKGMGLIRMPINSRNLYTTAFGALDITNLNAMKAVIDYCFSKNLRVIIDMHNFGQVWDSTINAMFSIFPVPGDPHYQGLLLFNDFWSRLSSRFKNYPNIIIGQMNEPSQGGINAAQWQECAASCLNVIRAAGSTQLILLAGQFFDGAHDWTTSGNSTAWHAYNGDTANNFMFEMHQYLDSDFSGTHPVATQNGSTIMVAATAWLVTEGRQCLLTEFGFAPDPWRPSVANAMNYDSSQATEVTNGITQGTNLLNYMTAHATQWPGWAYWSAGDFPSQPTNGGYAYSAVFNGGDQPQIAPLVANL